MASAQASSSAAAPASRKLKDLQAGKKVLAEFRKKKNKVAKKDATNADETTLAVPDVVENPPPNANNANSRDGLVSDVDMAVYENGPTSSSRGAEFLSNGPVTVNASVSISNVGPLQDSVSDGGSKFYGNLSFSDLVNGHHDDWRGDAARKREEHSPEKDVPLTSILSAFRNTNSLGSPSPSEVLPSWGRDSLLSEVRGAEQSSSYSTGGLFGKSESTSQVEHSLLLHK